MRSVRRSRGNPRRVTRKNPSWFWRYRRLWFLVGLVAMTGLAGVAWVLTHVPLPPAAAQAETTIIYDASGAQLATLYGQENRFPVKIDQVPKVMQDAVVAAEDRNFFSHGGIDPVGIARATWADIRHRGIRQGASTITQQYVKNAYVGSDRTLWRKLREAVIAVKIERKLDKNEILERYLNTVYFGRGAYGIQAAARTWFGKDAAQLELREAVYLAGIIRSPTTADVATDPDRAREVRGVVLAAMVRDSRVSQADADAVNAEPLETYVLSRPEFDSNVKLQSVGAEYFVEYVRRRLIATFTEEQVLRRGLRVYTSLDPVAQRVAYESVYGLLDQPEDPAGALVALDPEGRIVAMVGGRDWAASKVNLALGADGGGAGRQGGSTFKPFVLAETVREGYSLESAFPGPAKLVLPKADNGGDWEVNNYEDSSFGQINLIEATVNSVNTVYAQLVTAIGPEGVVDMARDLGVSSPLRAVNSIALGTQDVSVLDMAGAYHTLAGNGLRFEPRSIVKVTLGNTVLIDDKPKSTRVLERAQADKVNFVLEQVVRRGSGVRAQVPKTRTWGKTGTTDDFGDAWFVGFTRKLTAAVWIGYPEGQSKALLNVHGVAKVSGGSLPAQIFGRFMSKVGVANDAGTSVTPRFDGRPLRPLLRYGFSAPTPTVAKPAQVDPSIDAAGSTTTVPTSPPVTFEAPTATTLPTPPTTQPGTPITRPTVTTRPPAATSPRRTITIPDFTP